MQKLAKAIFPDFPEDRTVKETPDRMKWYRILHSERALLVPSEKILKTNMLELDKYIESLKAFAVCDLESTEFDWDNLVFHIYSGQECLDGLKELLTWPGGRVACDIETRQIHWEDNRLLAIGFAVDENTCYAFYNVPEELYPMLERLLGQEKWEYIWHNGKFDCGRLKYLCNIDARVDHDTMLQHYAQINEKRGSHGLKMLGQLYLQSPAWDDELQEIKRDWCKKNKVKLSDFMYDDIPTEVLVPYMCRDCIATFRLNHLFETLARPGSEFIYHKLIEASEAYMRIELAGLKLDLPYLEDLEWDLEQEISAADKRLRVISKEVWNPVKYAADTGAKSGLNETFNHRSPKQLKWMLQEVLGHPVPSTDQIVMQSLLDGVEAGKIKAPLAKEFIESIGILRKYSKYMDTYVQGIRDVVCSDYRIRSTYNLHGTETGRLSSSNPNLQNIPRYKPIKNLFISQPGYKLVQLDYSQAELRVLAVLSEDPWLRQVYIDGKDLHDAISIQMFGEGFDKEQRNLAKTINFGIAYGRGPSSLAEKFGVSMPDARKMVEDWFKPMPKVREYIQGRRRMASRGDSCVTLFGRERHFVLTNEDLNHIQNEYINTPIQSAASDLTVFSLLEIDAYLRERDCDAKIVATVHDSIIIEVPDDDELITEIADMGVAIMEGVPMKYIEDCKVPFVADVEVGTQWGDMKKWPPEEVS